MSRPRALALLALLAAGVACSREPAPGDRGQHGAAADGPYVCPPCGMRMAADSELRELGGMRFALCNELCAEKVAADPGRYAKHAVER